LTFVNLSLAKHQFSGQYLINSLVLPLYRCRIDIYKQFRMFVTCILCCLSRFVLLVFWYTVCPKKVFLVFEKLRGHVTAVRVMMKIMSASHGRSQVVNGL
jgi:hypothetical protein